MRIKAAKTGVDRAGRSRWAWRALIVCLVAAACGAWLLKGTGAKTRIVTFFFPRPPRPVVDVWPVAEGRPDPAIRFDKIPLPQSEGAAFTCVQIGPDHRLYAGADDGRIFRFRIHPDGTVDQPQIITSLQQAEGGKRLLTGFCFDPASTAQRPIIWASHGYYGFKDVPDFTGRITRLRGRDLQIVDDAVVGLPRSIRDHLNNQPAFGPDGALYFPQGSNSSSGAPDPDWGMRPEHLLNASILRLDIHRITPGQPLDVRTKDAGGTYDPYAPGAPLTIYASGIRNAYDLVWGSDGHLYVPVNGASCNGCAPAGPGAPALVNLPCVEDDWLFRIVPGKYYGHPNPPQHHFVLNGGNPDGRHRPSVIPQYPVGTQPDPDWQPALFDFGPHISADGIIEYRGDAFGGKLDRKLVVCRFNVGSDLIFLGIGPDGKINSVQTHVPGADHFESPLDVAEDRQTGNLYVAEYAGKCIMLLRPLKAGAMPLVQHEAEPLHLSVQAAKGQQLFNLTCIACHGPTGAGIPNLGPSLRDSRFVASQSDDALVAFIKRGRQPGEAHSVMNGTMPAKGANPDLDDASIREVIAFVRALQSRATASRLPIQRPTPAPD